MASRLASGATAFGAACLAVGVLAAGRARSAGEAPPASRGGQVGDTVPARRVAAPTVAPCEVPVLRRDTLRDAQGRAYYLAPDAMLLRDGVLFIAGQRSVWTRTGADGRVVDGEQDGVLATLREANGAVRTFARPAAIGDVPLQTVRAAMLPNDRWALLFSEHIAEVDNAINRRVWVAVLSRTGWASVVPIMPPASVRILDGAGVPLNSRGEHLLTALPAIRDDDEFGALLLEGPVDALTTRFVPLPGVAYVTSSFVGSTLSPAMFAVHPNRGVSRSSNALFHYPLDRSGVAPVMLSDGVRAEIHFPHVYRVPGGYRVLAHERSMIDRAAADQLIEVRVPDSGTPQVEPLVPAVEKLATSGRDSTDVLIAITSRTTSGLADVTLFRRPGPGRGMRLPVSVAHTEVLGVAWDGAQHAVVATLNGDLNQAMAPSLALTWVTPRCRATSGQEDGR
ncbi:MAG: hypothetical protein MUD17_07325 [Gemmatimonadaceae bacterium]|jgi:hypothetical protein|nr:hypothetical protein [Gemmatimonadaceae bacterium]